MKTKNVLVIMSDEHNPTIMGCAGNPQAITPNLDRLATTAVQFNAAYTPSPICISARASFATGLPVFQHRCWSSAEPFYGQQQSWMLELREQGHEVTSIGKLHYRSMDDDVGFTESLLPMYLANNGRGWPQSLLRKPMTDFPQAEQMARLIGPGETSYTHYDRDITATATNWLKAHAERSSEKPWVLFVSFISPHFPLSAPQSFYDLYRDTDLPKAIDRGAAERETHPVMQTMRQFWDYDDYFSEQDQVEGLRNYYGLCSFLDDNIGQIINSLEFAGLRDDTAIVYTSDHGDLLGNHDIWGKCFMYEESARIPLLVDDGSHSASINNTPVSLNDIGASVKHWVSGVTNQPAEDWQQTALQSYVESPDSERPVISEYHDAGSPCGITMLRQGPWKLIAYADGHTSQLYNLADDPQELNDLGQSAAHQDELRALQQQLADILDTETVNQQAFADQAQMINTLGGRQAIQQTPSFNHTPLDGNAAAEPV